MIPRPPRSTPFPTRRSSDLITADLEFRFFEGTDGFKVYLANTNDALGYLTKFNVRGTGIYQYNPVIQTINNADRKSTRLNSSHSQISYAVFCLKKKNNNSYN